MKIKELIEKHTVDGEINWEKVETESNEQVNSLIGAEKKKAISKTEEETGRKILQDLGVDNIETTDQLKEYISKLSDSSSDVTKIKEQYEKELADKEAKLGEYEGRVTRAEREKALVSKGITDTDMQDYLLHTLSNKVTEEVDFNKALEEYANEKPHLFQSTPITTGGRSGTSTPTTKLGWEVELEKKNPNFKDE